MHNENQNKNYPAFVREARRQLQEDAERAKSEDGEFGRAWTDTTLWGQYIGKASNALYKSYTDEELLNMLRNAAAELGRQPAQKEIFCVYRMYIRRRFKNWPRAMIAAGLGQAKPKPYHDRMNQKEAAGATDASEQAGG